MKTNFGIQVIASSFYEKENHEKKSRLLENTLELNVTDNLDEDKYVHRSGMPTKDGCEVIMYTLIQAIMGNIHTSHQMGYRDSAEHFRAVIKEMETLFVENPTIRTSHQDE